MWNFIDNWLNRITMYRLVLYYLLTLWLTALIFGALGLLPYQPPQLIVSALIVMGVCLTTDQFFRRVFKAPTNAESVYITAFILLLIITPLSVNSLGWNQLPLLFWAAVWGTASKYIFAVGKKHIFNPAAIAVALTALVINQSATWWVGGNLPLLPLVLIGGLLLVRKLRHADLVWSFLVATALSVSLTNWTQLNPLLALQKAALHSPVFFFAFVMLTEPLTTPPDRWRRINYGFLVGLLFAPSIHIGSLYSTPELALLIGNLFSYLISPKWKELVKLTAKTQIGQDIYDFSFTTNRPLSFRPGQYLEWTIHQDKTDNRGNRRYFTIASSPTEQIINLGIKFHTPASQFKKTLLHMQPGDTIAAGQLSGDFVLPRHKQTPLIFVAGGIGITPFRSMIKYLIDNQEQRDIILLYVCKSAKEFVYQDIFKQAASVIGLKTIYILTDNQLVPPSWDGYVGRLDEQIIQQAVPDYLDRTFYLSGPPSLITSFKTTLIKLNIKPRRIRTDFFPGFA